MGTETGTDWLNVAGAIAAIVAALGVVIAWIYDVTRNRNQNKMNMSTDIATIKEGVKNLTTGQKDLSQRITKVADDLAEFRAEAFRTFVRKSDIKLIINNSPPDLSAEGEKVAEQSKINQFIERHQKRYFKELDQTRGDAELFKTCIRIASRELQERNEEDVIFIQDYFYNAGIDPLTEQIFAIKLRNIYQQQKAKKTA